MELVDGASRAQRLARGPLGWREAAVKFSDVAAGLEAIHAAGLVHRDLKPANLLVDGERLRIADFGLAVRTTDSALAGTLPRLAPELLAGAPADRRSDVYALFATMFEAVTGGRPYRELDRRALLAAAKHGRPVWPRSIPSHVRHVIERGLAPDPAHRWPDAASAHAALLVLAGHRRSAWARLSVGASGAVLTAVVIALGMQSRSEACEVQIPPWNARVTALTWVGEPATLERIRARLASYSNQLADARAAARSAPATAPRVCLLRVIQRVEAVLAPLERHEPRAANEVSRALFALPSPAACATWQLADSATPGETIALADAQAAVALDLPKRALERLSAISSTSPLAGDAEVTRGQAALALGKPGRSCRKLSARARARRLRGAR